MTNKIFIKTYGCALNQSDSEALAGVLKKARFELVEDEEDAELVIVNSCIVKGPTESKVLDYIRKLKGMGKKMVVAGCMAQAMPKKAKDISLLGIDQLENIVEVVEETLNNNTVVLIAEDKEQKNRRLLLPRIRRNSIIEIIPICAGCLGNCAYCIVKKARGELFSYDKGAIIDSTLRAINQGAKELWLTAQDTGCYGKDIGESLPELLDAVLRIPGNFKVRLGMANPNHVKEQLDELIRILKHEKMFRFIHIPVQSGSDRMLEKMQRKYTRSEFLGIVKRLREEVEGITIATDMICGFPGETDEDFKESLDLIQQAKPDVLNISRFWKRKGTKAAGMKQLSDETIHSRSRRMASFFGWTAHENAKKWDNWQGKVLIDEKGNPDEDGNMTSIGRNFAYKQVVVKGDLELGRVVDVKVLKSRGQDLRAALLD